MKLPERPIAVRHGIAAALAAAVSAAACGAPLSSSSANVLSPSDAALPQSAPAPSNGAASVRYDAQLSLTSGHFTIATTATDVIEGAYTGQASVGVPSSTARLELTVTGGQGRFAGASGSLQGTGNGSFTGEGAFEVSLKGFISRIERSNEMPFRATISGTSQLSCSAGQVQVTLQGEDPSTKLGPVAVVLQHLVSGGNCSP